MKCTRPCSRSCGRRTLSVLPVGAGVLAEALGGGGGYGYLTGVLGTALGGGGCLAAVCIPADAAADAVAVAPADA